MDLPDSRGKHNSHAKSSDHYRWNHGKIISNEGYVKVRVGINHPCRDEKGRFTQETHTFTMCKGMMPPHV